MMHFLRSAPATTLKRAIPTSWKKAIKGLLAPEPRSAKVKTASKRKNAASRQNIVLTGAPQRITIPPLGSAAIGVHHIERDSVVQVRLDHAGMADEPAKLLLEGIDQDGQLRTRRWIKNEKHSYKTSFISGEADEDLRFRLANKSKQESVWIDLVALNCVRLQGKPNSASLLTFCDGSVTVAMATYPARAKTFPDAVESLVDQCDHLLIYLNNYREVPAFLVSHPKRDKIHYILDTASDLRAAAKFTWASKPGYHVICDDDIIYPSDYVQTLISKIEQYGRKAVIGVHAALFMRNIPASGNHRTEVLRFQLGEERDRAVNLLGTGTIGYHSDTVRGWDWSVLLENRISNDEALAVLAKRSGVPLVAIAREEGWMKSHEDMEFGIYEEKALMPETHAKVLDFLRENEPWPDPVMPESAQ